MRQPMGTARKTAQQAATHTKESLLHVEAHLVVVELHNLDEALKGADDDRYALALGRLAHDLHDVVTLALALHVLAHELERVEEGVDGGVLDLGRGLLLARTLDDGRQDVVRLARQDLGLLRGGAKREALRQKRVSANRSSAAARGEG
jgi:hypothetical protein